MIANQLKFLTHKYAHTHHYANLDANVQNYIENSGYPKNHTFLICNQHLLPNYKLLSRYQKISSLYPNPLKSLLDLSCCKGYFVFLADALPSCERTLGIDVDAVNIDACHALKKHLNKNNPSFQLTTLESLASNLENFGGAFQTVLLANTYQYLYFGSDISPGYLDHEKIFGWLNTVCADTLIFSNRVELKHCQNIEQVKKAGKLAENYHSTAILNAAQKYFTLVKEDKIGKYPLWVFKKHAKN